jgi:hypothetical protein
MPYSVTSASKLSTLAVGWVASFTLPIRPIVVLTICFIAADFAVGIITSYRVHRRGFETIKAWRTAFKLSGALTCIVAAYGIEVFIFQSEEKYLARGVAGILCGFDFYSMLANFAMLSSHPAFMIIKRFVKAEIKSKLKRMETIDAEEKKEEEE